MILRCQGCNLRFKRASFAVCLCCLPLRCASNPLASWKCNPMFFFGCAVWIWHFAGELERLWNWQWGCGSICIPQTTSTVVSVPVLALWKRFLHVLSFPISHLLGKSGINDGEETSLNVRMVSFCTTTCWTVWCPSVSELRGTPVPVAWVWTKT